MVIAQNKLSKPNSMKSLSLWFSIGLFFFSNDIRCQNLTREQNIIVEEKIFNLFNSFSASKTILIADEILAIDSNRVNTLFRKGVAYHILKDHKKSLQFYNRYFSKKPNSNDYSFRAKLKLDMGDTAGALKDAERAMINSGYEAKVVEKVIQDFGPNKRLIPHYEKIAQLHPDNFMLHVVLGKIREKSGDQKEAAREYSLAANSLKNDVLSERRPRHPWVFTVNMNKQFDVKNLNAAIEAATDLVLLAPEKDEPYLNRIGLYISSGESAKACSNILYLKRKGVESKVFSYATCDTSKIEIKPTKEFLNEIEAAKWFKKGFEIEGFDSSSYRRSVACYSKAIELKPDDIYSLGARVWNYIQLHEKALELLDLDKIVALKPNLPKVLSARASARQSLHYYLDALDDVNTSLKLDSTDMDAWRVKASIEREMGDTSKAISDLTRAISINPNSHANYFERGLLELECKINGDPAKALKDFLKAIEIYDNTATNFPFDLYYYYAALAYNEVKSYKEAIYFLEKAIAMQPKLALNYYRCGEVKARIGDMNGACKEWNTAKQLGYERADELILYNCGK
jgi:tetratricopeptide (TPR) repeat protein